MERQANRAAFAKACAYLNYNASAKWWAHGAAASTGLIYVALLGVLWLFADLLVYRGQIPNYRSLTSAEQSRFQHEWDNLRVQTAETRLIDVGFPEPDSYKLARAETEEMSPEELEKCWRAEVGAILRKNLGTFRLRDSPPSLADKALSEVLEKLNPLLDRSFGEQQFLRELDRNLEPNEVDRFEDRLLRRALVRGDEDVFSRVEQPDYDQQDNGLLSLMVRTDARNSWQAPFVAWLAHWNSWTWNRFNEPSIFSPYLNGLLILGVVLAMLATVAAWSNGEMAARACIEASNRLRRAVYLHTYRLGTLAFRALGPTEAVTVFTRHVEAVNDALHIRLTVYFRMAFKFVLLVLFALVVHVYLAMAFLVFAGLIWMLGSQIVAFFARRSRQATNEASERLTEMRESLMMMRLVKCYMMEPFNRSRVERQLAHYADVQMVRYRGEAIYQPLLILLGTLCTLLLLYVAGVIIFYGQLGVPGMIALATALVSMYSPVAHWLEARRLLKRGYDSSEQLFTFLERRGDVGQMVGAEFLHPLSKQIEFDNVSLREPGSNRMLLEEVTLSIPAGKRIGLIGADDLEKHALVYLIPRLLDPTSGEIRIDQHNLRWVTLDSLRNQIATVLQHNLVFHDTVANNIGCGDSLYTLPQIIEAAKIAHAHHFIQKLPQGYDTPIGELGHALTVSQQFRISLARAILRDPALLIIEEPETTLDEDTKSLLDDTMARILPGRTAIFIPHRISTIRSCDALYLLHRGHIAATGQHKELLAQNPLYRHLHYLEFNEIADHI